MAIEIRTILHGARKVSGLGTLAGIVSGNQLVVMGDDALDASSVFAQIAPVIRAHSDMLPRESEVLVYSSNDKVTHVEVASHHHGVHPVGVVKVEFVFNLGVVYVTFEPRGGGFYQRATAIAMETEPHNAMIEAIAFISSPLMKDLKVQLIREAREKEAI